MRNYVFHGERPVRGQGAGLDVEQVEMLGEQLFDGGGGPQVALLVDLDGQTAQRLRRRSQPSVRQG